MLMMRDHPARVSYGYLLLATTALVWAGMVIGVSGLATPIKFAAPSLALPVALDVGRVTFHLFSRIEWGFAGLLILIALAARTPCSWLLWIGLVVAIVAAQAIWLLPALDARVADIIAGVAAPPSEHHVWYVVAEIAKLAMLLALGMGAISRHAGRQWTGAAGERGVIGEPPGLGEEV